MFIQMLYAQGTETAAAAPQSPLISMAPMILIFVIFYFLLIRPQQKKQKELQKMIGAAKKNDRVVMSSGIIGTIVNIRGNIIDLKVDDNTKLQMLKSGISQVLDASGEQKMLQENPGTDSTGSIENKK